MGDFFAAPCLIARVPGRAVGQDVARLLLQRLQFVEISIPFIVAHHLPGAVIILLRSPV